MAGQDYTPDPSAFPEFPWTLVKDGEDYQFDSIMLSLNPKRGLFGKCMQAIAYLRAKADGYLSTSYHYPLAPRSVTRVQQGLIFDISSGLVKGAGAATISAGEMVTQPLNLPHGSTLTSVTITIDPGGHSALPAVMPSYSVVKMNAATSFATVIGSITDTSANTTAFNAAHALTVSGLSEVIDRSTYYYYVLFTQESGSNSASGNVGAAVTTVTVSAIDDAY